MVHLPLGNKVLHLVMGLPLPHLLGMRKRGTVKRLIRKCYKQSFEKSFVFITSSCIVN